MSLGAGLPFARPARSALTLAAVVLGVTTVTFATGLATTMTLFEDGGKGAYDVTVYAGGYVDGKQVLPVHGDRELQSLLGSLPGAARVTARADEDARLEGSAQRIVFEGRRGPDLPLDDVLVRGALDAPSGRGRGRLGLPAPQRGAHR
ncbi:hypothetical protein ACIBJF_27855 [Streptomyces sp. NPDC050743]|uniref:hypothetical protein n=1 Tax=Streptomyces sp. NPDC050743 TaxID=3365634 RepID=UPI00379A13D9